MTEELHMNGKTKETNLATKHQGLWYYRYSREGKTGRGQERPERGTPAIDGKVHNTTLQEAATITLNLC